MRTPTQKQWATVIEKLYSVLPFTFENDHHLSMLNTSVNGHDYQCGTVHCVGGWYAVANWQERVLDKLVILNYANGADAMAKDLGFSDMASLALWASWNADLWGNHSGIDMFASPRAYNTGNGDAKNLIDVIHHFEFVADNCKKVKP